MARSMVSHAKVTVSGRTSMHRGRWRPTSSRSRVCPSTRSVAARMRSASAPNAWASAAVDVDGPDEDGGGLPASDPDEQLDQVAQRRPLVRPALPSRANARRWNGTAGGRCWDRPSVRAARPDRRGRCPRRRWPPPSRRARWLAGTARSRGPVRASTTPRPGRTRRGRASRGCPAAGPRGTAPRRRPGPRRRRRRRSGTGPDPAGPSRSRRDGRAAAPAGASRHDRGSRPRACRRTRRPSR